MNFKQKVIEILKEDKGDWINDAITKNAKYRMMGENCMWEKGTWVSGTWEVGQWSYGKWLDGVWKKGVWKDGTWFYGEWLDGLWKYGTWKDGKWKKGKWKNGTWEKGWIYDPKKIGNFEDDWDWDYKGYVRSPIDPKEYFSKVR
jgi:hypothetical protein